MCKPKFEYILWVLPVLLLAQTGYGQPNAAAAASTGLAGIYSGDTTYYRYPGPVAATPKRIFGAVGADGTGYFIAADAANSDIQVFQKLQGKGRVSSPEREVPTAEHGVARGAQNWQIEIKSKALRGNAYALAGTFNCGDCYIALRLRMKPLTHRPVMLNNRAGTYQGLDINRLTKAAISLDSAGHVTGTDALGCRLSGTLIQVGTLNLFDTRLHITGAPACHGAMTGLAFFDTRDRSGQFSGASGSYLYLMGANSDFTHGFAMALAYQRK